MPITTTALDAIDTLLNSQGLQVTQAPQVIQGGDSCDKLLLVTVDRQSLFIKYHANPPPDFFSCEADNLDAIRLHTALRVPLVIAHNQHCLILEYLGNGQPAAPYWQQLAAGLASLHQQPQCCFGFNYDNFCGTSEQPNPRVIDGISFFSDYRLGHQIKLATDKGLLEASDHSALDALITQLPTLLPAQAPVLIHGDLWSGNIHCDANGNPCLIDPACYWGWREADIAMTTLFGGFPDEFYRHYHELLPMEKGWQQRLPFYNLYHQLNHLNLFGAQYLPSIRRVINRFV
jgi:protein-ribulosamine 3-kinase